MFIIKRILRALNVIVYSFTRTAFVVRVRYPPTLARGFSYRLLSVSGFGRLYLWRHSTDQPVIKAIRTRDFHCWRECRTGKRANVRSKRSGNRFRTDNKKNQKKNVPVYVYGRSVWKRIDMKLSGPIFRRNAEVDEKRREVRRTDIFLKNTFGRK